MPDNNYKNGGIQEMKTVEYNYSAFGCPNRTYYSTPFTFDLHL